MMNCLDMYQRKKVSVEEALNQIQSHHEIVCALVACELVELLSHLHTIKDRVEDVSVVTALLMGQYQFFMDPEMKGHFLLNNWFYTDGPRAAHPQGTVSYVPMELHRFSRNRIAHRKPDVFMGSVSPMDKHGYMTLSLCTVLEKDFIDNADTVILEVNPNLPRTFGDTQVHISQVDFIVETDRPVPEMAPAPMNDKDRLIGEYVADLIEDGSTIQIGTGSIPGAVALGLRHKKDLGVHSEMFTECLLDLYEAGAITNRRKTLWKDKFIAGVALGTRRLYDFLDDNMAVEFYRGSVVNDPRVISQNYKMVSVNSALQMDLTGQCCAESVGDRLFSGTGGHKEFINGALDSPGGKSILAFYATTKQDTISRIVPQFDAGTIVTTSRIDVDHVVTEYGVACLRGKSIRERVQELIRIAHPHFRDQLDFEARRKMIW